MRRFFIMKNSTKHAISLNLSEVSRCLKISENEIRKELSIKSITLTNNHSEEKIPGLDYHKWLDPELIKLVGSEAQLRTQIVNSYSKRIKESKGSGYKVVIDEINSITEVCLIDYKLKTRILNDCSDFLLQVISELNVTSKLDYFCEPWSMEPFRKEALKRSLALASTSNKILKLFKKFQDLEKLYNEPYVSAMNLKVVRKLDKTLLAEIKIIESKSDAKARRNLATMFKRINKFGNKLEARRTIIKKIVDLYN